MPAMAPREPANACRRKRRPGYPSGLCRVLPRRGLVLPLAILAAVVVGFMVVTFTGLNRSYRGQVELVNKREMTFTIAYSAYSRILARIYLRPWADRYFKDGPVQENGVPLFGGEYDSFVEDSGKARQADIYIRSSFLGFSRLYLWRVAVRDDILDIGNRIRTLFFGSFEPYHMPVGSSGSMRTRVNQVLATRAANRPKAADKRKRIAAAAKVQDIIDLVGARTPGAPSLPDPPAPPPPAVPDPPDPPSAPPAVASPPTPPPAVPPPAGFVDLTTFPPTAGGGMGADGKNFALYSGDPALGPYFRMSESDSFGVFRVPNKHDVKLTMAAAPDGSGESQCRINLSINGTPYWTDKLIANTSAFQDFVLPADAFEDGQKNEIRITFAGSQFTELKVKRVEME